MDKFFEYAPLLIVVIMFLIQHKIFVTPEQLEKKHREILGDCDSRFVLISVYLEFKEQIIYDLKELKEGVNEIKQYLLTNKD